MRHGQHTLQSRRIRCRAVGASIHDVRVAALAIDGGKRFGPKPKSLMESYITFEVGGRHG